MIFALLACRQGGGDLTGVHFQDGAFAGTGVVRFRWSGDPDAVAEVVFASRDGDERVAGPFPAGDGAVPLVGLRVGEPVSLKVRLTDGDDTAESEVVEAVAAPAPEGTPAFRLARRVPESCVVGGYVLVSTLGFDRSGVQILDDEGFTVWAAPSDVPGTTVFRVRPAGDAVTWLAVDETRTTDHSALVTQRLDGAARSELAVPWGHHDFVEHGGGFAALAYSFAELDLPDLGTVDPDPVVVDQVVTVNAAGDVRVAWDALDPDDWPGVDVSGPEMERCPTVPGSPDGYVPGWCEYGHGNSLVAVPGEDAWLVMFRWLDALARIDAATGAVDWVMGGSHATLTGPVGDAFEHAHASEAWRSDDGLLHVLVADNRDRPPGTPEVPSRFGEYAIDEAVGTFQRVWSFQGDEHEPLLGDVVRIPGCDHVLISFSGQGRVAEVTRDGEIVWDVDLVAGNVTSRVTFLPSLP